MSNNPQYPGFQPLRPPNGGHVGSPQGFPPSMNFQFRPSGLAPQSDQYMAITSQNFQPIDRNGSTMNCGFSSQPQPQPHQFMPTMHQFFERPNQIRYMQPTPLGPPALTVQSTGSLSSRTSLPQPAIQNPAYITPSNGGTGPPSSSYQTTCVQPKPSEGAPTDWVHHTSADGRRYFFNKRTKQSTWEKPFELMTPLERADATTNWKEHSSPDGRKYYYNKVTKQSTWSMPDELKIARDQVDKAYVQGPQSETSWNASKIPFTSNEKAMPISDHAASAPESPSIIRNVDEAQMITDSQSQPQPDTAEETAAITVDTDKVSAENSRALESPSSEEEEAEQGSMFGPEGSHNNIADNKNADNQVEDKKIEQELVSYYANKSEALDAFKSLLGSANVGSDWTWEQAMRVIINDRRYGALRTLGERKQAFNEFLVQKRKEEEEEKRAKERKKREEFKKMFDECVELTPSTRWSKAVAMFENDERFKLIERERDRRDIFEDHINELKEKERLRALEERKQNIIQYRNFLESCSFIKPNSQWRKVQAHLEADERCLRLEKIDRIEIFQEYLRDLEREEEERKKILKEELKKVERKRRDEFRKLVDEHIAAGVLTAKTRWHEYSAKVRDSPVYSAIASNTSGATPKDLFEDAIEELQKQNRELKSRIKDAMKHKKISLSSASTFDEFKLSISDDISSPPVSDVNLKLAFDDLIERVKEKEQKEAKKRKRLAEDLVNILRSFKDITSSSSWEDCKHLVEGSQGCSSIGDENFRKQTFEEYVAHLKDRAAEAKRREDEKDMKKVKYRREKESEDRHEKASNRDDDYHKIEGNEKEGGRRSRRSGSNRHRERRNANSKENETDRSKGSHKHGSGHEKSRHQRGSMPEADEESREKRRKKDDGNGAVVIGHREDEELEDGECGRY